MPLCCTISITPFVLQPVSIRVDSDSQTDRNGERAGVGVASPAPPPGGESPGELTWSCLEEAEKQDSAGKGSLLLERILFLCTGLSSEKLSFSELCEILKKWSQRKGKRGSEVVFFNLWTYSPSDIIFNRKYLPIHLRISSPFFKFFIFYYYLQFISFCESEETSGNWLFLKSIPAVRWLGRKCSGEFWDLRKVREIFISVLAAYCVAFWMILSVSRLALCALMCLRRAVALPASGQHITPNTASVRFTCPFHWRL